MTVLASHTQVGDGDAGPGMSPLETRLARLLDAGSMDVVRYADGSGVMSASGRIGGEPVVTYAVGTTTMDGGLSVEGGRHVVEAIDIAVRACRPIIGVWHSGGVRLTDGVEVLAGLGRVLAAIARASGKVPQISVVLGSCGGGVGQAPALTDIVIATPAGRLPDTGSVAPHPGLRVHDGVAERRPAGEHGRGFDGVHLRAGDEADALAEARRVTALLARPGRFDLGLADDLTDPRALLPRRAQRAYDVRPLLRHLLDDDTHGTGFEELQPKWAPNMVVGLGRLAGRTVGVLANNPLFKGGCLDSPSAEKAARFVRMCDALGVPMIVVADVPGHLPGNRREWHDVVHSGAKLLHAFAEAVVPRVTLVTRKSHGGGYVAMNPTALGATAVFAWPDAEIAVMSPKAALRVLNGKGLDAEREKATGGTDRAVSIGVVDEVIVPAATRRRLAEALAAKPVVRGTHDNIPL